MFDAMKVPCCATNRRISAHNLGRAHRFGHNTSESHDKDPLLGYRIVISGFGINVKFAVFLLLERQPAVASSNGSKRACCCLKDGFMVIVEGSVNISRSLGEAHGDLAS